MQMRFIKAITIFTLLTLIYSEVAPNPNQSIKSTNKSPILPNLTYVQLSCHISDNAISPSFRDLQGSNIGPTQIQSFKSYIDLASAFYRDDTKARLDYISNRMNSSYGVRGDGYSIITMNSTSYWDGRIISFNAVWGMVSKGSDPNFPQAGFLFLRGPIQSGRSYFQYGSKGSGITSDLENVINNIIKTVEGNTAECQCQFFSYQVQNYIRQFDQGAWSVFCSSSANIFISAYTINNKYIITKPRNCYVALYDIGYYDY